MSWRKPKPKSGSGREVSPEDISTVLQDMALAMRIGLEAAKSSMDMTSVGQNGILYLMGFTAAVMNIEESAGIVWDASTMSYVDATVPEDELNSILDGS